MQRTEDGKIEIKFEINRILKFIRHIAEVNSVASAIYHLTKTSDLDHIDPLETDGLAIKFVNENGSSSVTAPKIVEWVFKKAFEDFIIGLTQSLTESYILLKSVALATKYSSVTCPDESTLQKELDAISLKAHKLHFPTLIENIEEMLQEQLSLKEEIISINQVRNCLVHKNAIVTESPALYLKYIKMQMYVQKGGQMRELTKNLKSEKFLTEKLEIQSLATCLAFKMGEHLVFTPDIFKDVTYTCILFIHELIYKLPLPQAMKDQIVSPFTINLITDFQFQQ